MQEIRMNLYAPIPGLPGRESSEAVDEIEGDQFAAFAAAMGMTL